MEESQPSLPLILKSVFALILLALSPAPPARAGYVGDSQGISPFKTWRTIETDHFRINFPSEQERFAQLSAGYLEEAWTTLTEQLYWRPSSIINVTVLDNTDDANGSASPFARLGIFLNCTPPEAASQIAYTDDWIRLLVWHELTHFVQMDTTRSFYSLLRVVFGDSLLPNTVLPLWMLEGMAVFNETRFSRYGRGRSPYWEGILRAGVVEDRLGASDWITIDRLDGWYPWFPGGQVRYLFGYYLLNQVARDPRLKQSDGSETRTADGENSFRDGEDALGLLSYRSAGRIPFFINGNLENVVSLSWYDYWAEFLSDTRTRMSAQLERIRSQSLTPYDRLTEEGFESLGPTLSPDGKWLAYTTRTAEERYGLRLVDLASGESTRLDDKLLGVGMSFSPDSKWLIYSEQNQRHVYDQFSDLHFREIPSGKTGRLTRGLRAKDPDLSRDALWLTYTVAEKGGNVLAISPVEWSASGPRISPPRVIFRPDEFGRVANPRFSKDGKRIVFSVLKRGKLGEDLMEIDVDREVARPLVSDGHRNVFPAFAPDGELYFVSSKSGVENLFHYRRDGKTEQVTNVATGLWTPAFGPSGLYASILSTEGWDISRVYLSETPIDTSKVKVVNESSPPVDSESKDHAEHQTRTTFAYNPLKTLLPRVWGPELQLGYTPDRDLSAYFGAFTVGFDALDIHYYMLRLGFRTISNTVEGAVDYHYRGLGPTLGLHYEDFVPVNDSDGTILANPYHHLRAREGSASLSIPVRFTWSTLTPYLALGAQRRYLYSLGSLAGASGFVPMMDASLSWTDLNSPALAIHPIAGRRMYLGARFYSDDGAFSVKGLFKWEENVRIWKFFVASPSLAASAMFPFETSRYVFDNVILDGIDSGSMVKQGPMASTLRRLRPRGYATGGLFTPWALYPALDLRLPLLRIFEGLGTNPVFAENLWMQAFVESVFTQTAYGSSILSLPSAGAGLRLDATLFLRLPLVFGFDVIYATDTTRGGGLTFAFGVSGLDFSF